MDEDQQTKVIENLGDRFGKRVGDLMRNEYGVSLGEFLEHVRLYGVDPTNDNASSGVSFGEILFFDAMGQMTPEELRDLSDEDRKRIRIEMEERGAQWSAEDIKQMAELADGIDRDQYRVVFAAIDAFSGSFRETAKAAQQVFKNLEAAGYEIVKKGA